MIINVPDKNTKQYKEFLLAAFEDKKNIDEFLDHLVLEIGDVRKIRTESELEYEDDWDNIEKVPELIAEFCRNPDNIQYIAKYFLKIDLLPFQLAILHVFWFRSLPMFIASRGAGKSYLLAVYIVLRMMLHQGCKIAVVGASLRQSMVIFNYVNAIYESSSVLQDICGKEGPKRDIHMCHWSLGSSKCIWLPLGNGDKIRGQRANIIIADEFGCLEKGSLVETTDGLIRIEDFAKAWNTSLVTGDGKCPLEKPNKFIKTPPTDVYEIKLSNGYVIRCSDNHQVMTKNGWKTPFEINAKDWIEKSSHSYFGNNHPKLTPDLCWLLGLLVSEGSVNNESRIEISTTDHNLAQRIVDKFGWKVHIRPAYIDKRYGWKFKESYQVYTYDISLRNLLYELGLNYTTAHQKIIPSSILTSSRQYIVSFLSGLFEDDGSCFLWNDREQKNLIGLAYYSVSERLCRDVQILMNKLGYDGYINKRKSKISKNDQWFVRWNNHTAKQAAVELSVAKFLPTINAANLPPEPTNITYDKSRNQWKTSIVYCGRTMQKRFQTKDEAITYVNFIKSLRQYRKVIGVRKLDLKDSLYDYYLPVTNSFYAEGHRQHNSIPKEIFETVVRGFAAVKSDGVHGNVSKAYKDEAAGLIGLHEGNTIDQKEKTIPTMLADNQIIVAGTAYFQFNHFYQYYKYYRAIILTGGNKSLLKQEFPDMKTLEGVDPSQYAIIRLPHDKVPVGMMDKTILKQGEVTMGPQIFSMEYGAIFPSDSTGFYLATSIHKATCPTELNSGIKVDIPPKLIGEAGNIYVMGVDPASEDDNFAINIIELNEGFRCCVYQWTTNRKEFEELKRQNLVPAHIQDYNTFCIHHIRLLLRRFNIVLICLDSGGGGVSIREGLRDPDKLLDDSDKLIFDLDDENVQGLDGKHIIKMIEFASSTWRRDSHWGLKKDISEKILLFPNYDPATLSVEMTGAKNDSYETLEDNYVEIEQCKQETILIRHGQTVTGQENWDVPKMAGVDAEQVRKTLKRDRFTSLLLANWAARLFMGDIIPTERVEFGGSKEQFLAKETAKSLPYMGEGANKMKNMHAYLVDGTNNASYGDGSGRKIYF